MIRSISQRDHARVKQLSDRLINRINAQVEQVVRNGDTNGYPGCVNLSFAYVEGESLLMALKVNTIISIFRSEIDLIFLFCIGYRTFIWQCLHICVVGTIIRPSGLGYVRPSLLIHRNCLTGGLGAAEDMAHSSLRFGIGRFTTEAEIDYVVEKIVAVVQKLRDMRYVTFHIRDMGYIY